MSKWVCKLREFHLSPGMICLYIFPHILENLWVHDAILWVCYCKISGGSVDCSRIKRKSPVLSSLAPPCKQCLLLLLKVLWGQLATFTRVFFLFLEEVVCDLEKGRCCVANVLMANQTHAGGQAGILSTALVLFSCGLLGTLRQHASVKVVPSMVLSSLWDVCHRRRLTLKASSCISRGCLALPVCATEKNVTGHHCLIGGCC